MTKLPNRLKFLIRPLNRLPKPAMRRKQNLRDVVQGINPSKEDKNQREEVQGKEECEKPINDPKEG